MRIQSRFPVKPLSDFVEQIWHAEGAPTGHEKERLLPDGSMALVINLREDELRLYDPRELTRYESFRGAIVCGARSKYTVIDTASQIATAGVQFRPGGAFPFLGMPARELCNATVSLEDLWGPVGVEIRERLLEAGTAAARLSLLERLLTQHATAPLERHGAVTFALGEFHRARGQATPGKVTERIGLSSRRFIEVFSREVGLTPKRYCRVHRFQEVVTRVGRGPRPSWADLAVSCGYFDQAHFIHDFREFCGLTPEAWFEQRGERHPNHVPIRD